MKIIKKGEPRTLVFKCEHCGCVFEAGSKEYAPTLFDYKRKEAVCPYCGKIVLSSIWGEES